MALYLDAAREIWREWIINYDFNHQVRLSTELGNRTNSAKSRVRLWYISTYRKLLRRAQNLQLLTSLSPAGNALLIALIVVLGSLPLAPRAWRAWQLRKILRH